jgi:hypothetical protein
MIKLTNDHAAVAPLRGAFAPLRDSGGGATVVALYSTARIVVRKPARPNPLRCVWSKDAAGHLVCSWSDDSTTETYSIGGRGLSRAGAAMRMAA